MKREGRQGCIKYSYLANILHYIASEYVSGLVNPIQGVNSLFHVGDTFHCARSLQRLYPAHSVEQEERGPRFDA